KRVGEAAATRVKFPVGETARAIDDRNLVGIDRRGARQETERRQRREIGRIARQMRRIVNRFHRRQPLLRSLESAIAGILPLPGGSVKREPASYLRASCRAF